MNDTARATLATDIEVPCEVVTLKHLRSRDGAPVRVKVYPVSPLMAGRAGLALPGATTPPGEMDEAAMKVEEQAAKEANLRLMLDMAAPIVEDCTAFARADGGEVRPAFYFGLSDITNRESLPGRVLHAEDLATLVATALRLAGYGAEVAEQASFRPQ